MGLVMKDEDFLYGLELAMRQPAAKEEFFNNLEKQESFQRLFAIWAKGDAELISKEKDDKFEEEYAKFFNLSLVILGSLFSANDRKFPNITKEIIDEISDRFGEELESCSSLEEQRLCEKRLQERVQNLNPLLKDFLSDAHTVNMPTSFGIYCAYQLANIFLEQAEKEQKDETDEILQEAEAIKNGKV